MSVELRIVIEGECTCGTSYPIGSRPPSHVHHIECDWGRIQHADPRPECGDQVGHLMLTTQDWVKDLISCGPIVYGPIKEPPWYERRYRASIDGERIFVHLQHRDMRWTWELFEAHWEDGCKHPLGLMIGRWPD